MATNQFFPTLLVKGIGKRSKPAFGVVKATSELKALHVLQECRTVYRAAREQGTRLTMGVLLDLLNAVPGASFSAPLSAEEAEYTPADLGWPSHLPACVGHRESVAALGLSADFVAACEEATVAFRLGTACRDRKTLAVRRLEWREDVGFWPVAKFGHLQPSLIDEDGKPAEGLPTGEPLVGEAGELACAWASKGAFFEALRSGENPAPVEAGRGGMVPHLPW